MSIFRKAFIFFVLSITGFNPTNLLAVDRGDFIIHTAGGWNQDLKIFQGRTQVAYAFWDDFSLGPVLEYNAFFYAPGMGVTWHLEPFEILAHTGPLYWRSFGEKKSTLHVSIHASYMMQITTHFELFVTAGVNLPEKYFRGVPIGAGLRYWF